jgi:hypothetical protein
MFEKFEITKNYKISHFYFEFIKHRLCKWLFDVLDNKQVY